MTPALALALALAPEFPARCGERRVEGVREGGFRRGERRVEGVREGGFGLGEGGPGEQVVDVAVRRNARTLHATCAELLPGYAAASREPWRQALLTAGCLDARPRRAAARHGAPPLIVEDVVQPSDVLCALWLARRCGLFSPGSSCGDAVGLRSACEIIPAFAPGFARCDELLATLRANTAWRAHLAARAAVWRAA